MGLDSNEVSLIMSALDNLRTDISSIRSDLSTIAGKLDSLASDANGRLSTLEEKVRVAEVAIQELRTTVAADRAQQAQAQANGPNSIGWWIRAGGVAKVIFIWIAILMLLSRSIPGDVAKLILDKIQVHH
jgi:hypothetical protein